MTKNTHMEHLEDLIINEGYVGGLKAIRHLMNMRESFDNITVKWDGAPAVFFGIDPADGKFFIAKKGIFNKNPKVYKSTADIVNDVDGDLCVKLVQSFHWLSKLNIAEGVYQGDLMWTADDVTDGSVHPNTLLYEIPESLTHKYGIVVHTRYTGSSFETMTAEFIQDIPEWMTHVDGLWIRGAGYTGEHCPSVHAAQISKLFDMLHELDTSYLDELADCELSQERLKCFVNTFIRSGDAIDWQSFNAWNDDYFSREMHKRKTVKGKAAVEAKWKKVTDTVNGDYDRLTQFYDLIMLCKNTVVIMLNQSSSGPNCYLLHKDGLLEKTFPEGYVSISKHGAVKFVDRYTFSKANFSDNLVKGWH